MNDWLSRIDTAKMKEDGEDADCKVLLDGRVTRIQGQAKDASSVDKWTITQRAARTT